ncbi:hypothetical protein [Nocardiopsis alba]|uniref:hypothetical protein n=1 Tax=Nocardiopsis alba TaxID=53437 RepID=UPI00339E9C7B
MTRQSRDHEVDAELAMEAARVATVWISAETSLPEDRGWTLVALRRPDSGHEEAHIWGEVGSWARRLHEAIAQAGQDRRRVQDATRDATLTMRGWLEDTLRYAAEYEGSEDHAAARARLRGFIDAHGQADRAPASR